MNARDRAQFLTPRRSRPRISCRRELSPSFLKGVEAKPESHLRNRRRRFGKHVRRQTVWHRKCASYLLRSCASGRRYCSSAAWEAMAESAAAPVANGMGDAVAAKAHFGRAHDLYRRARQPFWAERSLRQANMASRAAGNARGTRLSYLSSVPRDRSPNEQERWGIWTGIPGAIDNHDHI
jgi:hypothetical protein